MIRNDIGKALPGLNALKLDLKSEQIKDKMLLVCFFDMEQRPSRNFGNEDTEEEERRIVQRL